MNADYGDISLLSQRYLELITWISDDGESEKKLSIVESVAPKWEKISAIFNLRSESIKNPGSGTTPEQCLRQVLSKWQEKGDQHYPFNWSGLLQLLKDIDHGILAKQLEEALASQQSTVRDGNLHHLNQMKVSKDTNEGSWIIVKIFGIFLIFAIVIVGVFFFTHHFDWNLVHQYRIVYSSKSLPFISDNFVGREDELEELLAMLNFKFTETRIVSILGSPGFGKSTLAIKLGHKLVEQGVDVHYANLDGAISENIDIFIAEKILKSDGRITKRATFERFLQWGRERSGDTLLILDNCDSIFHSEISIAKFVNGIGNLILSSKSIKTITTSREMPLLHTHHHYRYKVYQLSPKAAISLLNNKLPEHPLEQNFKEQIAEYTGNVPLALHIVGSLLTLEDPPSPETVIKELKSNAVQFLSPNSFPSHLRIDASISLSYKYLDKNLKKVALYLSIFSGSFSKYAPIAISTQLKKKESNTVQVSLTQDHLRALVDRSLLEYNQRENRYQYHRLIRDFLRTIIQIKNRGTQAFLNELRTYFLKELHLHTVGFDRKYVDSLKFLDSERHNIYTVLTALSNPEDIPRKLLLMTVDYLTKAIDVMYLTCRFTYEELYSLLSPTLAYLDFHIIRFQKRDSQKTITDFSGTTWTQKEYYQRIYIQLVITFSDLVAKIMGEKVALVLMENRQLIVDHLLLSDTSFSDDSSYSNKNSDQEHTVVHKNIFSYSTANPSQDRAVLPLAPRAQKRLFYDKLSSRYFALGNHSKVLETQVKIMDDINNCKREKCSYREIGYIYFHVKDYAEAARYFELFLHYEKPNVFTTLEILFGLFYSYNNLREWPWMSEEERSTLDSIVSTCHKIREQENDTFFHEWKLILKATVLLNPIKSVDFLEERLFSVLSTPNARFQLKPNDALSVLKNIEKMNNNTKIVLWGSLLLKPFDNYNNFSIEETIATLQIKLSASKAHVKLGNGIEGFDGMENIYKTILARELQDHNKDTLEIHSTVCFYLIIRLKYIRPCYNDFLDGFPIKMLYAVFVLPVRFHSNVLEMHSPKRSKTGNFYTQSTAVVFEKSTSNALGFVNEVIIKPFVLTLRDEVMIFIRDVCNYISRGVWYLEVLDTFIRFIINLITVYIRLKLAVSLILATFAIFLKLLFFLKRVFALLYKRIFASLLSPFQKLLVETFKILFYHLRNPLDLIVPKSLLVNQCAANLKATLVQTIRLFIQSVSFANSYELIRNELCLFRWWMLWWILIIVEWLVEMMNTKFGIKVCFALVTLMAKLFMYSMVMVILFAYVVYL